MSTTGESRGSGSGALEGGRDPSPPSLPPTATAVNHVRGLLVPSCQSMTRGSPTPRGSPLEKLETQLHGEARQA